MPHDGAVYKVSEMVEGDNGPVWHPFCRCSTAPYYSEEKMLAKMEEVDREYKELEQNTDHAYIMQKIASGEWGMKINPEMQRKHMEGTALRGSSYLFADQDPQELLEEYTGKGYLEKTKSGERSNKEVVKTGQPRGVDARPSIISDTIKIHHSKNRTHIVITSRKENDDEK